MPLYSQFSLSELSAEYSELEEAIAQVFGITEFAAKKSASSQPKPRNCNPAKSIPCGAACVRKMAKSGKETQCRPKGGLKGSSDAKQASDWLAQNANSKSASKSAKKTDTKKTSADLKNVAIAKPLPNSGDKPGIPTNNDFSFSKGLAKKKNVSDADGLKLVNESIEYYNSLDPVNRAKIGGTVDRITSIAESVKRNDFRGITVGMINDTVGLSRVGENQKLKDVNPFQIASDWAVSRVYNSLSDGEKDSWAVKRTQNASLLTPGKKDGPTYMPRTQAVFDDLEKRRDRLRPKVDELLKQAQDAEDNDDYDTADEIYNRIQRDYPVIASGTGKF